MLFASLLLKEARTFLKRGRSRGGQSDNLASRAIPWMRTPPSLAVLLPPLWWSAPWTPSGEGEETPGSNFLLLHCLLTFFLTLASANSLSCPGHQTPAPNSIFFIKVAVTFFLLFHICFIITTNLAPCYLWINWYFELFYGLRGCHISEYVVTTPNIACVLVCSGHHNKVP